MSRPKSLNPKVVLRVRLPEDLYEKLEIASYIPGGMTRDGRSSYGPRNQIIEIALRKYFADNPTIGQPNSQVELPEDDTDE